jgi:hypothetical protein
MPVGGEGDARAIGAPRRLTVVRGTRREAPQRAIGHGDGPQVLRPVADEAHAVHLVQQPVDDPCITLGWARATRRPRTLAHGRGDEAQPKAIRRPGDVLDILGEPRELPRLATIGGQQPDLDLAVTILGCRLVAGPIAGAALREHRAAVAQERDGRAIRAPAGGGVPACAQGQPPLWCRAIRGDHPERRAVSVPVGRRVLDREADACAVG